ELVTWIQESRKTHGGIVINAGGYTHTSVAILDALLLSDLPVIEVHITHIHGREKFRRRSLISKAAVGLICGLGIDGYAYALQALVKRNKSGKKACGRSKTRKRKNMPTTKFDLDAAFIRKLAKLLEETGLSEIEYAEGDKKIRCAVTRGAIVHTAPPPAAPPPGATDYPGAA